MSKHIACLAAAAVMGAVLPAAAADYYDGGDRPLAFHGRDELDLDGGRARFEHRRDPSRQDPSRQDLGAADGDRRAPGPVVFDERGLDRRFEGPASGSGEPGYRRPAVAGPADDDAEDRPAAFLPPVGRPRGGEVGYDVGDGDRPAPLYRPAAVPVGPAFDEGYGGPDVGCTIQQARSTTPLGWRKIVTHRTCYRR